VCQWCLGILYDHGFKFFLLIVRQWLNEFQICYSILFLCYCLKYLLWMFPSHCWLFKHSTHRRLLLFLKIKMVKMVENLFFPGTSSLWCLTTTISTELHVSLFHYLKRMTQICICWARLETAMPLFSWVVNLLHSVIHSTLVSLYLQQYFNI
jgi:hypothetical protein